MTAPLQSLSTAGGLERVFAETNRVAAPCAADRARITDALRARLGPAVVPEGCMPAAADAAAASGGNTTAAWGGRAPAPRANGVDGGARPGLGRGGWLSVVVGTGVVAGALGFVLGYGLAERERGAALDGNGAVAAAAAPAAELEPAPDTASRAPAPTSSGPAGTRVPREGASTASDPLGGRGTEASRRRPLAARDEHAPRAIASERAVPGRRAAPSEGAGRSASVEPGSTHAAGSGGLSFAEVLERVQRANVALRQGQATLALIQLAELDRGGGDVLHEEREATRALALCAIGDTAGARRIAAPLLSGATSSIYAPRLDSSCAREGGSTR
jgi:hypothetical protein